MEPTMTLVELAAEFRAHGISTSLVTLGDGLARATAAPTVRRERDRFERIENDEGHLFSVREL